MRKFLKAQSYWVEKLSYRKKTFRLVIYGPRLEKLDSKKNLQLIERSSGLRKIFDFSKLCTTSKGKVEYTKFTADIPVEILTDNKNFEIVKVIDFYIESNGLKIRVSCPYVILEKHTQGEFEYIPYSTAKNNFSIAIIEKRIPKVKIKENFNLNIYFLIYNVAYKGGQTKAVFDLAKAMQERNHNVKIISLLMRENDAGFDFPKGVGFDYVIDTFGMPNQSLYRVEYAIDSNIKFTNYEIQSVKKYLGSVNCDVMYFSGFSNELITGFDSISKSVVTISGDHSGLRYNEYEEYKDESNYQGFDSNHSYMTYLSYLSDGLHVVNPLVKNFLSKKPIDFVLDIPNISNMRSKNLLNNDLFSRKKTIVAVGRLKEMKNFDIIILAFRDISVNFPDWSLELYGEGGDRVFFEELVMKSNLEKKISFKGFNKKMDVVYENSSIHVVASFLESFGLTIVEAMGMGTPVISFGASIGARYLVEDGVTGFIAKSKDVDGLARRLEDVINMFESESNEVLKVRNNALDRVKQFYSDEIGSQWEERLLKLVDEKKSISKVKMSYKEFYREYWETENRD